MRAGGYTIQHTLTPEAATVVKQALVLARRRGHAQVTPLHVASAMLTSPTSLLRKACLQPNSHPLQCNALELCFNVALNRLPTMQSSPIMLNPNHSHHPSLSNALVAAFKRAQAHQRRGSIENQQQPILALKVEIEQLIISILDDPSVSRVMREAGFSSTQVKNNIEQMEISVSSPNPLSFSQSKENIKPKALAKVQNEDVMSVIEMMMNRKRKNIVVVRECLASADAIVRGVIDKFETENNINLRFMQFVSLPLHSLHHLSREDVEDKVRELKCLVKSFVGRGVILYLGDLKWVSDYWLNHNQRKLNRSYYYSPMEHMILELSGLMFGVDSGKLWLMGIANSQTYTRCKIGHPSLETLWDLCPLTLPVASLDLTLNLESSKDSVNDQMKLLTCCGECSVNFSREARTIMSFGRPNESVATTGSNLPSWLQQYKEENSRQTTNDQESEKVGNLCKKWNSICSSLHKQQPMSSSPSLHQLTWPVIFESNTSPKEHKFFMSGDNGECFDEANPKTTMPELLSNPNSSPNSASCSEASDQDDDHEYYMHKFKEVNSENEKILSNVLERVAPWQREIIPEIVSTILQCRSGSSIERIGKEETWLSFLGADNHGKEKIARELAKVIFGSRNNFVHIGLSRFSEARADSTDDDQEFVSNKRARDEHGQSYLDRFAESVQENANRVFFMEDVEQVDYHSQMGIKKAIKNGRITLNNGESVLLDDAIVIFSCESFSSISRGCSPSVRRMYNDNEAQETIEDYAKESMISLDLNVATEDQNRSNDNESVSDIGVLDSVDKQVIFKLQML
uniref:protein SMAX1-LIKE 3-like n=1 Tax=Erigeron canadensis TaxID=72917 RepID=UPI001CB9921B|nr:protein SMAX1-LIKE 3-like [Erigeron canadensis]